MVKELWLKSSFIDTKIPDWRCPTCSNGYLKIETKQFFFEETNLSSSWHSLDEWEHVFTIYRFRGALKCQNCGDFTTFLGRGDVDYYHEYNEFTREYDEGYNNVFYPLYFHPNLKLFEVNANCPEDIKKEIEDSFGHFWNDLPSCANKIRTSLELLMNQQKVKKSFVQKGKRNILSLHKRIEEFKKTKPETADFLLAIKWIGNTGSHVGKIEKMDILEAYELLEHSINKLFDDTEYKLKKMTKEINKRKGTRKRKA